MEEESKEQQQPLSVVYFTSIGFLTEVFILMLFSLFLIQLVKKDRLYKQKLKEQRKNQTMNNTIDLNASQRQFNMSQQQIILNRNILHSINDPDLIHTINSVNDNNMMSFDIHGKTTIDRRQAYLMQMQYQQNHNTNNNKMSQDDDNSQPPQQDESINYEAYTNNNAIVDNSQDQSMEQKPVEITQPQRFQSRNFRRKWYAFYKQCNPLINTWRYYMRLLPRWVRAFLILFAIETDLLLIIGAFVFTVDEEETIPQATQSKFMWGLTIFASSFISYLVLYVTTKLASASVSGFISKSSTSLEVVKRLKQLRKRVRNHQKILFMICSVICVSSLYLTSAYTNKMYIGSSNIAQFNMKFSVSFFCSLTLLLILYDMIYALVYTILYKMASGNQSMKSLLVIANKLRAWKVKTPVAF